jgi:hypothetical protein
MPLRTYIAIGGTHHARTIQLAGYHRVYELVKIGEFSMAVCPVEEFYVVRRFSDGGTRNVEYLVLESLSREEAERLIDAFEADAAEQPDASAGILAR